MQVHMSFQVVKVCMRQGLTLEETKYEILTFVLLFSWTKCESNFKQENQLSLGKCFIEAQNILCKDQDYENGAWTWFTLVVWSKDFYFYGFNEHTSLILLNRGGSLHKLALISKWLTPKLGMTAISHSPSMNAFNFVIFDTRTP